MFTETKKDGESQVQLEPWRRLLLNAADTIERVGHCKMTQCDNEGRMCFIGAVKFHDVGNAKSWELTTYGTEALDKMRKYLGEHPIDWNNAPERTGAEVVAGMRDCARSAI